FIYIPSSGYIRDRANIIDRTGVIFYGLYFVDRCPRPRRIEQLFAGYQRDPPARILGFFEKFVAFMLAGYTDDVVFHREFSFEPKEWHNLAVKTKNRSHKTSPRSSI